MCIIQSQNYIMICQKIILMNTMSSKMVKEKQNTPKYDLYK